MEYGSLYLMMRCSVLIEQLAIYNIKFLSQTKYSLVPKLHNYGVYYYVQTSCTRYDAYFLQLAYEI